MGTASESDGRDSPHLDPKRWDNLLEAIGLDSILLVIRQAMGSRLHATQQAEDLLQEALVHAWRDRESHVWNGLRAFKVWVLCIARNRILEACKYLGADKRSHPHSVRAGSSPDGGDPADLVAARSPTPGQMAIYRERATLMQRALTSLAPEHELVVRLHLFEDLPMSEIATQLGMPEATCWSRFRKGAAQYGRTLKQLLRETGSKS